MQPATRIASLKPYFFVELGNRIASLRESGKDVIRLDIGSPDLPPADFIVDVLVKTARRSDTHGYTVYGGTPAYLKAVTTYYERRFGVQLDFKKQVVALIGSKEGLFTINQVLLNPGDVALIPDPSYVTYSISAVIAGADVYPMPLVEENGFLPDLDAIPEGVLRRAKVLWLNYPNNPTGAIAPMGFLCEVVDFARQHDLIIAHDAPYVDVCFDGYKAHSILNVPGAEDVAVEFNSLSKAYNMAGWRLGMAAGNPEVVGYIKNYKSQVDTSHFEPILAGGIAAMTGDQKWINDRNAIYQKRRDTVLAGLEEVGFEALSPKAAIYIWTRVPEGFEDYEFCARLLRDTGISTTPGAVYGEHGTGYFRISLCTPRERIEEAMARMVDWVRVEI